MKCCICKSYIDIKNFGYLARNPENCICGVCREHINTLDLSKDRHDISVSYSYLKIRYDEITDPKAQKAIKDILQKFRYIDNPNFRDFKSYENKELENKKPEKLEKSKITEIIKNNFMMFLLTFSYFYFLCAALTSSKLYGLLVFVLLIQGVAVSFFLSEAGEKFQRNVIYNARYLTREEQDYILPIFKDVYKSVYRHNPNISEKIRIYIIDTIEIQAYALGRNTIMITKGAINVWSEAELHGILAHEFGHISGHFTKTLVILQTSMWIASLFLACFKFITNIIQGMIKARKEQYGRATVNMTGFILNALSAIPVFFFTFLFAVGRRAGEFAADDFADEIGYGQDLKSALQIILDIELTQKLSFTERLMNSHPPTPQRIARLEQ
ncbi:MAG: M48 family metalloprotease [Oscillospiraceae bacterium]|nr:M48 family metalloprotease [Oscillospiraceae bacterium]